MESVRSRKESMLAVLFYITVCHRIYKNGLPYFLNYIEQWSGREREGKKETNQVKFMLTWTR